MRESLVEFGRRLVAGGFVVGADGNLSVRHGESILITPSALRYERMTEKDIVSIDLDGRGLSSRSSEWAVHCEIYRERPEVHAVIHAHPVHACVLAVRGENLKPLLDEVGPVLGGDIRVAAHAPSGSMELARNAAVALAGRQAVILANHGVVTVGESLEEAFYRLEVLERVAQVQVLL